MKSTKISVDTNDSHIEYTQIKTGSKKICFMFSGSGYNYDKPLFYYATMLMLENQFDVVQIHYSYNKELFEQSSEAITNCIMNDVNPVIENVLSNFQYNEIIFLAKSLGTIPVVRGIMKREAFNKSKMILLTPLLKFGGMYEEILNSSQKGLLVIGDKDPHYDSEQLKQIEQQTSFTIEVIKGANHSLDDAANNTLTAILSLTEVMINLKKMIQ